MDRNNHYEAAFEAYLRSLRLPCLVVDETRRATLDEEPIKSLDFIVHAGPSRRYLIDVKGRKFPGGSSEQPRYSWQNWVTREDVEHLLRWQDQFGPGSHALLVFAYQLHPTVELPLGTLDQWNWRGRRYLFRAVDVLAYRSAMKTRSPRWRTVYLPVDRFREIVHPLRSFLRPNHVVPLPG